MRCKCTNLTVDKDTEEMVDKDTEEMDIENPTADTEEAKEEAKEADMEVAKEGVLEDSDKIKDTTNPEMRQALAKCTSNIIAEIVHNWA